MSTAIICIILVLITVFAVKSYLKKLSHGCCGGESDSTGKEKRVRVTDRKDSNYPYHKLISIDGMHCQNCVKHLENTFNQLDGFYVTVNLGEKTAFVRMKQPLADDFLRSVVKTAGYTSGKITTVKS